MNRHHDRPGATARRSPQGYLKKLSGAASARPYAAVCAFSTSMILGALAFEKIGGMLPCHLCMYQRYAHAGAALVALSAAMFKGPARQAASLAATALLLMGAGIAAYHVGVEQTFWGASCAMNIGVNENVDTLRSALLGTASAPCDLIAWSLLGISMAGWNALSSAAVGLWALTATVKKLARRPRLAA